MATSNKTPALVPTSPERALIGECFRKQREASQWTLRRLAAALETSVNTIRAHEAGVTPFRADTIRKCASLFGCRVEDLVPTKRTSRK